MEARSKPAARMTVADFLEWDTGGHQGKLELVDGLVRAMSPATDTHALIQANIAGLVWSHLKTGGSPCRMRIEPAVGTRVRAQYNLRVPDVGVTCAPNISGNKLMPDPILLIEVLSPGNASDTWDNVWAYTTIPSVQEILIVHSTRVMVELLRRGADGAWPVDPEPIEAGGALRLASIEAAWPIEEVYAGTHLLT
jgi:Uma2 family endonuclease